MSHRGKNDRIADLYEQLKLPPPMPKVTISKGLAILIKTGVDITICTKCNTGKLILIDSLINWNGSLKSVYEIKNRGNPQV
ncbi:MAG TPA: hypothetical protein PKD85_06800 [Saprospiraceae bacterium]|nr:hypothetical protein [Saprospiraceae bacterium]